MKYSYVICCTVLCVFLLPLNVHAYLGPGLGAGTIGAIIGVIVSIFLGIFAVIYYPIKRLLKKRGMLQKKNKSERVNNDTDVSRHSGEKE